MINNTFPMQNLHNSPMAQNSFQRGGSQGLQGPQGFNHANFQSQIDQSSRLPQGLQIMNPSNFQSNTGQSSQLPDGLEIFTPSSSQPSAGQSSQLHQGLAQQMAQQIAQLGSSFNPGQDSPRPPGGAPSNQPLPDTQHPEADINLSSDGEQKLMHALGIRNVDSNLRMPIIDNDNSGALSAGDTAILLDNGREMGRYTITPEAANMVNNGTLHPGGVVSYPDLGSSSMFENNMPTGW